MFVFSGRVFGNKIQRVVLAHRAVEGAEAVETHLAGADSAQVHLAFAIHEKAPLLSLANHHRREAALGASRDH